MTPNENYRAMVAKLKQAEFLPLLLVRLMLAYGFLTHIIGPWMAGLSVTTPSFTQWIISCAETISIVMLVIGLGTRIVSAFLLLISLVSFLATHWPGGITPTAGMEIPAYHILMLILLIVLGAGQVSVDHWIKINLPKVAPFFTKQVEFVKIEEKGELLWGFYEDF